MQPAVWVPDRPHALDLPGVEKHLLRIAHVEAFLLQREQHRRLDDIDAQRHIGETFGFQQIVNFACRVAEQVCFRRHGTPQSQHARLTVIGLEPWRVEAVVCGR